MDHRRLSPSTLRYVRRVARSIAKGDVHLADDLEQTTLLVALQKSPRDEGAERPWLFAICANTLRALAMRDRFVLASTDVELPSNGSAPLDAALEGEFSDSLRSALDALPPAQKEAVALRYLEGLPPREIASLLDVPVETVRTRAKRGLAQLRRDLQESGVIERRSSVRWPLAFGVPRFFKKRRVVALGGVAAVVGAVVIADRLTVDRSPGVRDSTNVVSDTDVALAPPLEVDGARESVAPTVDLVLTATPDLLRRWTREVVVDLQREGGESVTVRLDGAAGASIPGLEPGDYVARIDGALIGGRSLEPGPRTWELTWGADAAFDVVLSDSLGQPLPGADVFERNPSLVQPRWIGRTDGEGRARVQVLSYDSWIAARGRPGVTSESAHLGDPVSRADGVVELVAVERPIAWSTIEFPDEAAFEGAFAAVDTNAERSQRRIESGFGTREVSTWLPPWTNESGAYGLSVREEPWHIRVWSANGDWLWASKGVWAFEEPEPSYTIPPTSTYRGRFLDASGQPIRGAKLQAAGFDGPGSRSSAAAAAVSADTDDDGRFELRMNVLPSEPWLTWYGARLVQLPRCEGGLVELGDIRMMRDLTRYVEVRVVGIEPGDEVQCLEIAKWWRTIPAGYRVSALPGDLPEYGKGTDGRFRVPVHHAGSAGIRVLSRGSAKRARFVPRETLLKADGECIVDLSDAVLSSLTGRIDPTLLPCVGVLTEQASGATLRPSVDPVTGHFRLDDVIPGRWSGLFEDGEGRTHWSDRVAVCEPGGTGDLGLIGGEQARLRVMLPPDVEGRRIEGALLRIEWVNEFVASHVVLPKDVARGYVDCDVPPGQHIVLLRGEGIRLRAYATAQAGTTLTCVPEADQVELALYGWFGTGDQEPDARIEIYTEDHELLTTAYVANAAARLCRRVSVLVPQVEHLRIVYHDGDDSHEARVSLMPGRFNDRITIGPRIARKHAKREPDWFAPPHPEPLGKRMPIDETPVAEFVLADEATASSDVSAEDGR